jgi:uncharacterized protein
MMPGAGEMPYTLFTLGEKMTGGMFQITPDMQMPSAWLPYFSVEDADASAERGRSLGATVLMGPMDIPNVGRFAMLQDPQSALFYIMKMADMPTES